MNVLVTGGAGYVGSVVTEWLLKKSHGVYVLDNLQQGHRSAVSGDAEFLEGDTGDSELLDGFFSTHAIDAVMHMSGDSLVGLSMTDPARYFRNNIAGGIRLLDSMLKNNVRKIIFSSSAAVYGEPVSTPMGEDHPVVPVNCYGETKLMFERILYWYGYAFGLKHISLRYFNAAGASEFFGEDHSPETHLIPNVLKAALDSGQPVSLFGTDYPTRDGTCVRDYVHIIDIARAHVLALERLDSLSGQAFNLGSGEGYSVQEVIDTARKISGIDFPVKIQGRRAGDPAVLVASSALAKSVLGWTPEFCELEKIIGSAWSWMNKHPNGYED